jgi:hypothetical protein
LLSKITFASFLVYAPRGTNEVSRKAIQFVPCLQRVRAVPKSAFAVSGSRPKPIDHYESIVGTKMIADRAELCLVDDVITKGATLLAAASRLRETYPQSRVVAFALVRTLGFVEDIERIVEPALGTITLRSGEAVREP